MKYNEAQRYKKFLKVIEIPPIARLDAELMLNIKFYTRFLAIYISKMKRDWEKIDQDMRCKGKKIALMDHNIQQVLKCERENKRRKKYLEEQPECDDSVNGGLCLSDKEVFKDKERKRFQKKRKKKYKRIWNNCLPLSNYKGRISIDQDLVRERRKKRYEEERLLQTKYYVNRKKKVESL
jgi:hypothetical protein